MKDNRKLYKEYKYCTLNVGGVLDYEVNHIPIDYTIGVDGKGIDGDDNWGLTCAFRPLKTTCNMYRKLMEFYKDDEPGFIGGTIIPVARFDSIDLCKVYIIRCYSNGTTYFVSNHLQALSPFCT